MLQFFSHGIKVTVIQPKNTAIDGVVLGDFFADVDNFISLNINFCRIVNIKNIIYFFIDQKKIFVGSTCKNFLIAPTVTI